MGFFDIFKKTPTFTDDVFGELEYNTYKDSTLNFYSGEVNFQGKTVGIILNSNEHGSTYEQKEFFKKLDRDYNDIKETIILPFLRKELEEHIEETGLHNFEKTFHIDGISIGRINNEKLEWSITYDSIPMRHYVSIEFEDMEPKYMAIDG